MGTGSEVWSAGRSPGPRICGAPSPGHHPRPLASLLSAAGPTGKSEHVSPVSIRSLIHSTLL